MPETKQVTLEWTGGLAFRGGAPGGPVTQVDGNNVEGPSPMIQLLVAAAGCTGADIVVLLEKMRVRLTRFRLGVEGVRRDEEPRRYVALELTYELAGEGLDEVKARRAIDLSIEKYCSVLQSLAPDIPVRYHLALG